MLARLVGHFSLPRISLWLLLGTSIRETVKAGNPCDPLISLGVRILSPPLP